MSKTRTPIQPMLDEFAANTDPHWPSLPTDRRISDHIVRSEGFAGHASPYTLFEEMEDKDAHLFSALQTRKLGVLAHPRRIDAARPTAEAAEAAGWAERTLEQMPGWHATLTHLLDALGKGLAVAEIMWGIDADDRIVPRRIKPRAAGRFALGQDGRWRLLGPTDPPGVGRPLPPRKFLVATAGATDERPHGKGLCEKVYWYWWFKKHNLKFWLIYNEKFGSPTVVARHRSGFNDAERERLMEVIEAIQTDAGVTVPEGVTLELLEAGRTGSADTYRSLAQWCNDEISRAVLGQTLTSGEGERSGSLALGRVHEQVRQDYVRADARLLADVVNNQLLRPMIDLNFGEACPAPRWRIDLSPQLDLEREINIDRQLLQMGVTLPDSYFYEKYGRPADDGSGRRLQYDDSNLYHYHLQFGVLTINEVRSRLGLAPVAWGDRPTSPAGDPTNPPTPDLPAGEDHARKERTREREDAMPRER